MLNEVWRRPPALLHSSCALRACLRPPLGGLGDALGLIMEDELAISLADSAERMHGLYYAFMPQLLPCSTLQCNSTACDCTALQGFDTPALAALDQAPQACAATAAAVHGAAKQLRHAERCHMQQPPSRRRCLQTIVPPACVLVAELTPPRAAGHCAAAAPLCWARGRGRAQTLPWAPRCRPGRALCP